MLDRAVCPCSQGRVPQVPPAVPVGLENGAVTATAMPVAPVPPVLLRVRVWAALVVPRTTLVKLSEVGLTATAIWLLRHPPPGTRLRPRQTGWGWMDSAAHFRRNPWMGAIVPPG